MAQSQHASIIWPFTFDADGDRHLPSLERENLRSDWFLLFGPFCLQALLAARLRERLAQIRVAARRILKRAI
jgi:hypothetical protein